MDDSGDQIDYERYTSMARSAPHSGDVHPRGGASPASMRPYDSEGDDPDASYGEPGIEHEEEDEPEEEGEDEDQEDEDDAGEEEEDYAVSDTSSAMYDPAADPEGFARRQDELAGVLEMGEEEAKALKWGPAIGRRSDGTLPGARVSTSNFKAIINHHLTSTDWKYTSPMGIGADGLGGIDSRSPFGDPFGATAQENHPIRVLGRSRGMPGPRPEPESLSNGLGIEGLPISTR